jgi:hypothetical protein
MYRQSPAAEAYLNGRGPTDLRLVDRLSYPARQQLEGAVRSGRAPTRHGRFTSEERQIFSAGVAALTAGPADALAKATILAGIVRCWTLGAEPARSCSPYSGASRMRSTTCDLTGDCRQSKHLTLVRTKATFG